MKTLIALTSLALLSGCATITRGTSEVLIVETEPPGAEVEITPGGWKCSTPCSLELKRKRDYYLSIKRTGYEPVHVSVLSQISGAGAAGMAGNVLIGGLIGAGVDAFSGATKKLVPNPVRVKLVETSSAQSAAVPP